MKSLYLAWQDPVRRSWYPIGRLTFVDRGYCFVYTRGVCRAQQEADFQPLRSFPKLDTVYESDTLFPLFSNRVLSATRPDYAELVQWLNIPLNPDDPIALLVRTGGKRETDSLEVFPQPERTADGLYRIHFFVHGLRHLADSALQRISRLAANEQLRLMHDFQNPVDPNALLLRTSGDNPGDVHIVGYCPRYLAQDMFRVILECPTDVFVLVERLNLPSAPSAYRLLCSLTAPWPTDFRPFDQPDYQPVPDDAQSTVGV